MKMIQKKYDWILKSRYTEWCLFTYEQLLERQTTEGDCQKDDNNVRFMQCLKNEKTY